MLHKLTLDGLRFLSIPKAWKLANAEWDAKDITVPANGQITIPAEGLGSTASPGKLTLKPKYLHARFEFHDRKFGLGNQHGKKRVSIPPVPLQGWHRDRTPALDLANPGDPKGPF